MKEDDIVLNPVYAPGKFIVDVYKLKKKYRE